MLTRVAIAHATIDEVPMRYARAMLLVVLPGRLRRGFARRFLGWDIDPTARIGRSLMLVPDVVMGPGAVIGSMNVIKGIEFLHMGKQAIIGTRNHIVGFPRSTGFFVRSPNREPALVMGANSMITVGHEIDCSDRVELEQHAVIAGFRSQVLTHSLNLVNDRQVTARVVVGERSAVMSGCILMSGTTIPARSIISAGSVVNTRLGSELTFYRGNPAEAVRTLPETLGYFHRDDSSNHGLEPRDAEPTV